MNMNNIVWIPDNQAVIKNSDNIGMVKHHNWKQIAVPGSEDVILRYSQGDINELVNNTLYSALRFKGRQNLKRCTLYRSQISGRIF